MADLRRWKNESNMKQKKYNIFCNYSAMKLAEQLHFLYKMSHFYYV